MEYSINNIGGGYSSSVKPLSYGLANQSVTSTSFAESLQAANGTSAVGVVTPIQYPNARVVSPAEKAQQSVEVSKAFNEVAQGFEGVTNGYDRNSQGTSYELLGASLDLIG